MLEIRFLLVVLVQTQTTSAKYVYRVSHFYGGWEVQTTITKCETHLKTMKQIYIL